MDKLLKIKDACVNFVKREWQGILKPITVLVVICIVISLALSVTNSITSKKIAKLEEQNKAETMSSLVDAEKFEEKTFKDGKEEFTYTVALKDEKAVAYIYTTSAKGYGGDVSVMTAVSPKGVVKKVAILDVSGETPGLGQNAANKTFYSQFTKKVKDIVLVKNGADAKKNQINAVTGATITSKAVTSAVNEALNLNKEVTASLEKQEVTLSEE